MPVQFDDTVFYDPALTAENAEKYQAAKKASGRDRLGGGVKGGISGAGTGAAVGGPWGALIGGILGAGVGAFTAKPSDDKPDSRDLQRVAALRKRLAQRDESEFGQGMGAPTEDLGGMQSEMGNWELPSNNEMA